MSALEIYTQFIRERHRIWERRQAGAVRPWTENPILLSRKYTNVFRVLDPGSQFVLTDLDHPDPKTTLLRLFLYRHTNLPSAWRAYRDARGEYPSESLLGDLQDFWQGQKVFSGAYNIYPQSASSGTNKAEQVILLTSQSFAAGLAERFLQAETQQQRFSHLRSIKGVGNFMAMQILTDWGYTQHCPEDRENEFVVAGPGAERGAKLLRPEWKSQDTIGWLTDYWAADGSVAITLPDGSMRTPSLMDCQNTLCELSKHVRHRQRVYYRTVKPYQPAHPGPQPKPVFPASWTEP